MGKRILGYWRTFKHNVEWVYGYSKKVLIIALLLLLLDLVVLYLLW